MTDETIKPGRFISFEGIDGAGKTTHIETVCHHLRAQGIEVVQTREPGGTTLAETIRELILGVEIDADTEALLVFAARSDHLSRVIRPALARGAWVVSDRFTDASLAYQGGGRQLGDARVMALASWLHGDLWPDRTYWFDLPPVVAGARRLKRALSPAPTDASTAPGKPTQPAAATSKADRFESESELFFERVCDAYRRQWEHEPARILRVDAALSIPEIARFIEDDVTTLINQWNGTGSAWPRV